AVGEARQRGQAERNARQAEQNALQAEQNALQALDKEREALFQAYRARVAAAVAALSAHDVADAARQLGAAPEELRGWEWQHLHSRLDDSSSVLAVPDPTAISSFRAAGPLRIAALAPGGVRVTPLESGAGKTVPLGPEHGENGRLLAVAQTRRGLRLVARLGKSAIDLLDEAGRRLCRVELPPANEIGGLVVSPDATRLACV